MQHLTSNLLRYPALQKLIETFDCKIGIEVGVRECWLSTFLATHTKLEKLYLIDINDCPNVYPLINKFPNKIVFKRVSSPECSKEFSDNYFDFIHLDSCHEQQHVLRELHSFWPKLKSGGIMSGDDFIKLYIDGEGEFGVREAVYEFANIHHLQIYITGCLEINLDKQMEYGIMKGRNKDFQDIPNWWFIKP